MAKQKLSRFALIDMYGDWIIPVEKMHVFAELLAVAHAIEKDYGTEKYALTTDRRVSMRMLSQAESTKVMMDTGLSNAVDVDVEAP